jgi:hypothetical protein
MTSDQIDEANAALARIWKVLGISAYEQTKGKEISQIVADRISSMRPQVKSLDWQERYQTNADGESEVVGYVAMTGLGAPYRIEIDYFNTKEWQLSYGGVMGNFETHDEAKVAAQSDFERRVLSALAA